ncbi:28 kDa inner dynein arm light chain, axonemal [Varanus komodoensis]|nr:28 kDa inner dynein arm light chain, axonemal [Varanus komodoensis]
MVMEELTAMLLLIFFSPPCILWQFLLSLCALLQSPLLIDKAGGPGGGCMRSPSSASSGVPAGQGPGIEAAFPSRKPQRTGDLLPCLAKPSGWHDWLQAVGPASPVPFVLCPLAGKLANGCSDDFARDGGLLSVEQVTVSPFISMLCSDCTVLMYLRPHVSSPRACLLSPLRTKSIREILLGTFCSVYSLGGGVSPWSSSTGQKEQGLCQATASVEPQTVGQEATERNGQASQASRRSAPPPHLAAGPLFPAQKRCLLCKLMPMRI